MIGRARAALGTRGNRQDPRAAVVGPDCHPATKCLPSKTDALHIRTRSDSRLDRLAAAAALPRMSFHGTTPLIRSRRPESWLEHMRRDGCALHANDCAPVLLLHTEYPRARSCRRPWKRLLESNLRVGSRPAQERRQFRTAARTGLGHRPVDMALDRAHRQHHPVGHRTAGQPLPDQHHDFSFAVSKGQRLGCSAQCRG